MLITPNSDLIITDSTIDSNTGDTTIAGNGILFSGNTSIDGNNVNIEPASLLSLEGLTINATGALKLLPGDYSTLGILFNPVSITTNSLDPLNFFQQGQPLELLATGEYSDIYIGNTKQIVINSNPFIPSSITLQSGWSDAAGMRAAVGLRGEVEATGDIKLIGNDFAIDPAADITADNVIFCRRSGGRLDIHSGGHINFTELNTIDADYIFGDHGANTATEFGSIILFQLIKILQLQQGSLF